MEDTIHSILRSKDYIISVDFIKNLYKFYLKLKLITWHHVKMLKHNLFSFRL